MKDGSGSLSNDMRADLVLVVEVGGNISPQVPQGLWNSVAWRLTNHAGVIW